MTTNQICIREAYGCDRIPTFSNSLALLLSLLIKLVICCTIYEGILFFRFYEHSHLAATPKRTNLFINYCFIILSYVTGYFKNDTIVVAIMTEVNYCLLRLILISTSTCTC